MSAIDETVEPLDAKITAAQVLAGLAKLLRSDDPQMRDRDQRLTKAAQFDRAAQALLDEDGLAAEDYLRYSSEWTGNLSFLLGIHDRRAAG